MDSAALDRWCAERVMGWTQETGPGFWPNVETVYRDTHGQNRGPVANWHPSRDWAAVGQVLEALRAEWVIGITAWPDRYETVMERAAGEIGPTWRRVRPTGPAAIVAVVYAALTGQRTKELA